MWVSPQRCGAVGPPLTICTAPCLTSLWSTLSSVQYGSVDTEGVARQESAEERSAAAGRIATLQNEVHSLRQEVLSRQEMVSSFPLGQVWLIMWGGASANSHHLLTVPFHALVFCVGAAQLAEVSSQVQERQGVQQSLQTARQEAQVRIPSPCVVSLFFFSNCIQLLRKFLSLLW